MRLKTLILSLILLVSCNALTTDTPSEPQIAVQYCEEYNTDELFFSKDEVLTFPVTTIFVKPDSSYQFNVNLQRAENNLNSTYKGAKIQFRNVETKVLVDKNLKVRLVNYKTYLTVLDNMYGAESLVKVVFPDDVWFGIEMEGDKRVRIVQGAALFIGSNTYFVRESHFSDGVDAHEMGHGFDLLHPFQQPDNSHKGLSCDTGDFVIDTPNESLESELTKEEIAVYNNNIMSYYDTPNSEAITPGQVRRIRKHIENNSSKRRIIIRDEKTINYTGGLYNGVRVWRQGN